jgi:FtsZ-binding cell division protein ZapB
MSDQDVKGVPTTLMQNEGFISGKAEWSIKITTPMDSKHKKIIQDIVDLQKDSDLYQEKIATLDKENQDLFSVNMKLLKENEHLKQYEEFIYDYVQGTGNTSAKFLGLHLADALVRDHKDLKAKLEIAVEALEHIAEVDTKSNWGVFINGQLEKIK